MSPLGLLHPAFAAAASAAAAKPVREGSLTSGGDGVVYTATADGISLQIRLTQARDQWVVAEARHSGAAGAMCGVLDTFCQIIEGLPFQEAADHGAIHAIERMRADPLARPVPGILTPHSAGTAFTCCETLIRGMLSQHATAIGEQSTQNFWNPTLSPAWRSKTDEQRRVSLDPVLDTFRQSAGLGAQDLWIAGIEKTRRVVIGFGPNVGYQDKPSLLMRLEIQIRQITGDRLELFMEEAKDSNQIRRLAPDEQPS
jgi:hypothetical protein